MCTLGNIVLPVIMGVSELEAQLESRSAQVTNLEAEMESLRKQTEAKGGSLAKLHSCVGDPLHRQRFRLCSVGPRTAPPTAMHHVAGLAARRHV